MKKASCIIIINILLFQLGFAQSIDTNKLNTYFSLLEEKDKFMGSVALYSNGKIIYTNQLGFTNIQTKAKPNVNTKYRIGSITKTFTATLVFKAIEANKISLDQSIKKFFPKIENAKKITIGHLLSHRSGIHNFTNDKAYFDYNTQKKSQKEMLEIIASSPNDFQPNSTAQYSNSNYLLLSYILEKVYNKTYSEILKEMIVNPIKLMNTYVGEKIDINNNECYSYTRLSEWEKQSETDLSIPLGAGAIVSAPSDLLFFANALFNNELIAKESVEKMKLMNENYGMGLFEIPFNENISYGHTGGIDGFSSVFGYFSDENIGFAILSNGHNYDNNKIAILLLNELFGVDYEVPTFEEYVLKAEDLDKYLGSYSSPSVPMKITITKKGNTLNAQATGQAAFSLEATEKDIFKFDVAGVVLKFTPSKKEMILEQGGGSFTFKKE